MAGAWSQERRKVLQEINQLVSTASLERREKEAREGESTQKLEMARKKVEEAPFWGGGKLWEEM